MKQSKYLTGEQAKDKLDQAWEDVNLIGEESYDAPTLAVKAYIRSREQYPKQAIEWYNQIQGSGYRPVMVLNNRAYTYLLRKEYYKAADDLNAAAQLDPNCQAVLYNRAMLALYMRGNQKWNTVPATALDDIERAIQLGPVPPRLCRDAALLYITVARDDLARAPVWFDAPIVTSLHLRVREQRIERTFFHLRQAIANGQPADAILKDPRFWHTVNKLPAFAALRQVQTERIVPDLELRLIDPIDLPD